LSAAAVTVLAMPAFAHCIEEKAGEDGDDAEKPAVPITLDTVCYILEEVNNNIDMLVPALIQRLKTEAEQNFALEVDEDKINAAFQDLVLKVQDSVCRNEYVPLEGLETGIVSLLAKAEELDPEELLRFQSAMQRMQSSRLTVLQSLVGSRKEGATREIGLSNCIGILEGTIEGMNRAMEESYKDANEKGFAGEERTTYANMRYEEKMKVVNDEIQLQFDATGPAVEAAFQRFAEDPSFTAKLEALLKEQEARFEGAMRIPLTEEAEVPREPEPE
jgi:hypothetical protein